MGRGEPDAGQGAGGVLECGVAVTTAVIAAPGTHVEHRSATCYTAATHSLLGNVNQDSHPRAHFLKYATFGLVIKVTEIKGN